MSPRVEREEGPLSDPRVQRESQKAQAKADRINRGDRLTLEGQESFRRWFGKWAVPLLMLDLRTGSGSDLFHFMGRRSLVLDMIAEFELEEPGFYERVLAARRELDGELRPPPRTDQEE
jgi:hypothetical protein